MMIEIKHPFARLVRRDASVVFFEGVLINGAKEGDTITSFDDIPENYPRWVIATHSKEKAHQRIISMVDNEGWELRETSQEDLIYLES